MNHHVGKESRRTLITSHRRIPVISTRTFYKKLGTRHSLLMMNMRDSNKDWKNNDYPFLSVGCVLLYFMRNDHA
jgi:hypothetical protein